MTDDRIMEIAASLAGFTPEELQPERDRLIAFARAIRLAVLEESMQICDDFAIDKWNLYKGRPPYNGTEDGRANSYVEGESDGAEGCATAIRALADGDAHE